MIVTHRPSILKRPLRPNGNLANVENFEKEYEKEQARIRSHATWKAGTEERMRKTFYGEANERQELQQQLSSAYQQQMASRQVQEAERAAHERQCFPDNHTAAVPQDYSRPWTATTTQLSIEQEAVARQRAAAEAAEQNRASVAQRSAQEQQQRLQDRAATVRDHQSEDSYWNYGAASSRWIPPEQRVKHSSAASHAMPKPAPYTWNEDPVPPRPRSASVSSQPPPYSTHEAIDTPKPVPPPEKDGAPLGRPRTAASPAPFWTQSEGEPAVAANAAAARPCIRMSGQLNRPSPFATGGCWS